MVIRLIVALIFGANLGALTALWFGGLISSGPSIGNAINIDGWTSDWSIGSENANPYVRARVARNGLLAMQKEEAVYFVKTVDDAGDPLIDTCTYQVSGGRYPAGWWSITLYDGDSKLPMNEDERLSFDQTAAEAHAGESGADWTFVVSPTMPSDPDTSWVSSRAAGAFDLMLRLYQPSVDVLDDPAVELTPPSIERLSCQTGAN